MKVVADASVIVKWVLPVRDQEDHVDRALVLLENVKQGEVTLLQPVHWLAEVAAVLTRLCPDDVSSALHLLDAMDLKVAGDLDVFQRASQIARDLNHHVFDTLYHAVALTHGATLVSADDQYLRKARRLGGISSLRTWTGPS